VKLKVSALTFVSIVLMVTNLGVQALIAIRLGAGRDRDCLFVAMSIPVFINALLVGSLGAMITPAILAHRSITLQKRSTNRILFEVTGGALVLASVLFWMRKSLIHLLAPGFSEIQQTFAVDLCTYTLASIPFQIVTSALQGYWIARERIFLPSLCLLAGNFTIILLILSAGLQINAQLVAIANFWGALVACMIPLFAYLLETIPKEAKVQEAGRAETPNFYAQLSPLLLSGMVGRSTTLIERRLASPLNSGTVSCLSYAGSLMSFLVSATTSPVATAYYSRLCRSWNEGDIAVIELFLQKGIRLVLICSLALAGLIVLTFDQAMQFILPWTRFTPANAEEITTYVYILMVAYVSLACSSFIARIFYISGRFLQASLLDCGGFLIYLTFAIVLQRYFGGFGLAVATSVYALSLLIIFLLTISYSFGISFRRTFSSETGVCILLWAGGLTIGWLLNIKLSSHMRPLQATLISSAIYAVAAGIGLAKAFSSARKPIRS
jgi:peptidoglycan biosynthesis protein MviN/MurJ (putative lipid II flippase)